MTERVSRRNFFKLLGGGVALVVAPSIAVAEKIINIPVEFGWTWYIDKNKVPSNFSKLITETLRENTQKIAENISKNNALLVKLSDGQKIKLNIEQISEQEQNERIKIRMQNKFEEQERNRVNQVIKRNRLSKENEEYIRNKSEKALPNKNTFDMYGPETEKEAWARRKWVQDNHGSFKYTKGEPLNNGLEIYAPKKITS